MKSWTRTLNLAEAHTLLALAQPRMSRSDWERACYEALSHVPSRPRQTGLIRLVRETFLTFTGDQRIDGRGLFLRLYRTANAGEQEALVRAAWALSHDITTQAISTLVLPALQSESKAIPLADVDAFVRKQVDTDGTDALRKTRTTLLDALSGLGVVVTRGTGRHRSIVAQNGQPHPMVFSYLILRELYRTNRDGMLVTDAMNVSEAMTLTLCHVGHALTCIGWALQRGVLVAVEDEIALPEAIAA